MLGSSARPTTESPKDFTLAFDDELQNADERTRTLPESDEELRTESSMLQALEDAIGAAWKGPQNEAKDKGAAVALDKLRDPHWDECQEKKTMKGGSLNCTYGKNVNHGSVPQLEWMIREHKTAMESKSPTLPITTTPISAAQINSTEPQLHSYFGKELYRFAPFRQYPKLCGPNLTECPSCCRTDSWSANGYSVTFRRVAGLSKRSFAYTARYKCFKGAKSHGCGKEWQAWDDEMMAKYPLQVQHAMYFHTFLTDMHVYSDHLKQYAKSIQRRHSPAEAAALLKRHVPLIGKHSSTLFELCTNTYRYDGAWPSLDFLDEVCHQQFERIIKPIADQVQSSIGAQYLAFDTTKMITSKIQVNERAVFAGLEIACNEFHEIPHWAFRTSEDGVEFEGSVAELIRRLKHRGCKLRGIFLDNCCTWGDIFRRVFSSLLEELEDEQTPQIFLDRAHFLMRFTEAAKKDSVLWDAFRRDMSAAVCYSRRVGPTDEGSFSDAKKNVVQIPYSQDQMKNRIVSVFEKYKNSDVFDKSDMDAVYKTQEGQINKGCVSFGSNSGDIVTKRKMGGKGFVQIQGTSFNENVNRYLIEHYARVPLGPRTAVMRVTHSVMEINIQSGAINRGDLFLQQLSNCSVRLDIADSILRQLNLSFLDQSSQESVYQGTEFPKWHSGDKVDRIAAVAPTTAENDVVLTLESDGIISNVVKALAPNGSIAHLNPASKGKFGR
ncbi:hypothetical protein HDU80_000107 [Chytriomyces hyalinus]|nr:hypothetical protein HDU80_000107 [Chytriomyces hyalinus]